MGEFLDKIPTHLHEHLKGLIKSSKLPDGEETLEKIAKGWVDKFDAFVEEIAKQNMEEVEKLDKEESRGALALTYSGSLVNIGPIIDGSRTVMYTSIGLRTDTPGRVEKEGSVLDSDVVIDDIIKFKTGPVKSTSKIYKIAICKGNISPEQQENNLTKVMSNIEDIMLDVNKTILSD
jgi:hypothetical protein